MRGIKNMKRREHPKGFKWLLMICFSGTLSFLFIVPACAQQDVKESWGEMEIESGEKGDKDGADRHWRSIAPQKKKMLKVQYQRFMDLPPDEKMQIKENWMKFKSLSQEEQERMKRRLERWKKMSPEKREMIRERRRRFRALPPEKQQLIREKRKRLRALPPEQRKKIREQWKELIKDPSVDPFDVFLYQINVP